MIESIAAHLTKIPQLLADVATTQPAVEPPWWVSIFRNPLIPLALLFVFFMMFSKGKTGKQEKERQNMLKALKKGDRVQTIGGMIATVMSADDNEVLLKVDESSNTKIKFTRTAIHRVLEQTK